MLSFLGSLAVAETTDRNRWGLKKMRDRAQGLSSSFFFILVIRREWSMRRSQFGLMEDYSDALLCFCSFNFKLVDMYLSSLVYNTSSFQWFSIKYRLRGIETNGNPQQTFIDFFSVHQETNQADERECQQCLTRKRRRRNLFFPL